MTTFAFASQLTEDGVLIVPKEAVEELNLHPGDIVQVQIQSPDENSDSSEPTALERAMYEMINRTPEQLAQAQARAMEMYKPRRVVPTGKTLADMVSGKWPGDETDEQIFAALKELS